MARISKGEREQATKFIKESLERKKQHLLKDSADERKKAFNKAKAEVEGEYQVQGTLDKIVNLRKTADELEKSLCEKMGESRTYYLTSRMDRLVEERMEDIFRATKKGQAVQEVREKIADVDRQVFMATTHEDLADLVRELS